MDDAQIKAMVERFLQWKLPKDFAPDGGISYQQPPGHPDFHPIGTNLFDWTQATAMVRHMLGLPPA